MKTAYRFDRFEVDAATRRVLVDNQPASLGARALDILLALIERRDRLVTKIELLDLVWPGLVVEENNLQVQVSALRKLLGPSVIATIPGRGYRFTAMVDSAAVAAERSAASEVEPEAQTASVDPGAQPATNLPSELPRLYGREADLDALRALLEAHRLVTVVGAGGIGKSRLAQTMAQQLSERFPDGVWMVELAGLADPALLPNVVAQALNQKLPGRGPAPEELVTKLKGLEALLVLDNCEHLLDAAAALARAVIGGAPGVTVLATSQEPLHVADEQQFRVLPLAIPAATAAIGDARVFGAVAMFEARVRSADPQFVVNDQNLPMVVDVCRQLDGLPLAIELAAARVGTLGLRLVRDKLDARFKLLTGGARATLRRHQTLRAALEWSHNLLTDAERAVFRRLGVFAGGFTIETAQAVATGNAIDEWSALDHLSALVDKSLVVAESGETPRYRLLESARAFALEQLAAHDETADTLRRHATSMLDFLRRVDDVNLEGNLRTHEYAALVLPELDNLRAAYAWAAGDDGDSAIAVALGAHAGSLIDYTIECADWLMPYRRLVESGQVDELVAARYWRALCAGNMAIRVPRREQLEAARRAQRLYERLGLHRRALSSLIQVARHLAFQSDGDAAQAAIAEAQALLQHDSPAEFRIILSRASGVLAANKGRLTDAIPHHREEIRAARLAGDWRIEVIGWANLLNALWGGGPVDEAEREAMRIIDELRSRPAAPSDMETVYANALGILSEKGRLDDALSIAREGFALTRRTGNYFLEEWIYLFWRRGQIDAATRLLGALDARVTNEDFLIQPNEQRLIDAVRPALMAAQDADTFAQRIAGGAALNSAGIHALAGQALAEGESTGKGQETHGTT